MLNCLSEGGPELEYTWLFAGSMIANSNTLVIDDVNTTNGGDYTCNVTNAAGYQDSSITVYSEFIISIISCIYMHAYIHSCIICIYVYTHTMMKPYIKRQSKVYVSIYT